MAIIKYKFDSLMILIHQLRHIEIAQWDIENKNNFGTHINRQQR